MTAPLATVGVLSIGQMGLGISQLLLAHSFHVVTNVSDRSPATQERARSASVECLASDDELVARADYILSIVPPRDAIQTAKRILSVFERDANVRTEKPEPLYYLDLNAIAPETARTIGALFEQGKQPTTFIDGGIIGGPPTPSSSSTTWTRPGIPISGPPLTLSPLSGPHLASTLNTRHISPTIGTASGLKCTFAALAKGFTALALQSFTTAASLGVLPQLQDYLAEYSPGVAERAARGVTGCPAKAYRWVEEMNQIGECFARDGGWGEGANVFREVARVYERLADVVEGRGGTEGMGELEGAIGALTRDSKGGDRGVKE